MEAPNMKQKNWNKLDKRSSYSPVFKHGYSLETYLEFWQRKEISGYLYFFKELQNNSVMYLDFKK